MSKSRVALWSAAAALLVGVAGDARAAREVITFEDLPAGTIVTEVFGNLGSGPIRIAGYNERFGEGVNAAVIFDSANPTGEDPDLAAPHEDFGGPGRGEAGREGSPHENRVSLGKILIVAEDLDDADWWTTRTTKALLGTIASRSTSRPSGP